MIEAYITKKLGSFTLQAEISDGGFVCISGRNGAGKTSLLYCLAGVYKLDGGYVKVNGIDVTYAHITKRGFALLTYGSYIPHLSVFDHLTWGAKIKGINVAKEYVYDIAERFGIKVMGKVGELSLGNKIRVALATALIAEPNAILIDEIFSNIDDKERVMREYKSVASHKMIDVFFTTQNKSDSSYSDHHYCITDGKTKRLF